MTTAAVGRAGGAGTVAPAATASGAYTRFVAGALFPLQERLKRHDTLRVRRALEASQWWSADRLAALQADRLRALLGHAQRHVPHYRDQFAALGFDAAGVSGPADLKALPLLTKDAIRAAGDRLRSDAARGLARFTTGGSSGEPLIFAIGRERVSHDVAAKWAGDALVGVDIGDVETVVWGSPIELSGQDRVKQWRDRLMRTELLPAFEMSPARLDGFVDRIRARRPKMLFGYPSALARIAAHAERGGIAMDDLGLAVAFVTSERLYDDQRATIQRVFGCPVANGYGARDAGFIAHEAPCGGMHVTAEDVVVEIVDADGRALPAGEAGEIVVTHLATRDFPFIRYRTGDRAVVDPGPCACGRGLGRLREIQGRSTDFVHAADGTAMHGLALIYTLRDIPGIAAFKIVQESLQATRVLVVPETACDFAAARARIVADFKARLGATVRIDVDRVQHIRPRPRASSATSSARWRRDADGCRSRLDAGARPRCSTAATTWPTFPGRGELRRCRALDPRTRRGAAGRWPAGAGVLRTGARGHRLHGAGGRPRPAAAAARLGA